MRRTVRRHLGKVVAGAAVAVAGTAVMVGITLPGSVSAEESGGKDGGRSARAVDGPGGTPAPGVVRQAPRKGAGAPGATR